MLVKGRLTPFFKKTELPTHMDQVTDWFNYKARTINTPLSGPTIFNTNNLKNFIKDIPPKTPLYHCFYDLEKRPTFVDYEGLMKPVFDMIHVDFDSKEDEGEQAFLDVKDFSKQLEAAGIEHRVFFSGSKGFHVSFHMGHLGITGGMEKSRLELMIKHFCLGLKETYASVDPRIWNANRKFRAFRSQHEKTGLYKIDLDPGTLFFVSMSEIRDAASEQPAGDVSVLSLPLVDVASEYLVSFIKLGSEVDSLGAASSEVSGPLPHPPGSRAKPKKKLAEMSKGETIEDDSLKFKAFKNKLCIKQMLDDGINDGTTLPQFNRHDISLCLIHDLRNQGLSFTAATNRMSQWAEKVFSGEPDRIRDTIRQVTDAYKKGVETGKLYEFGCYSDPKRAYCSAKCKIYSKLNKTRRPEPLDVNKTQEKENESRRTPSLDLSEGELADIVIKELPELIKTGEGFYFQWKDTHWEMIDKNRFEDSLLKTAMKMYGNHGSIQKAKGLKEHIIAKIPMAPENNNFFSVSPNKFNFTDFTVTVNSSETGEVTLKYDNHKREDYLSYCAPFPIMEEHKLPRDTVFQSYLNARELDSGPEGVRVLKQMLGAALIPYVPRIFFLEGESNSGKSTLAKLIMKLLGEKNVSSVLPIIDKNGSERFAWEASLGKIANIVLELPRQAELDVNRLKMVRDKTPVLMDRKGRAHIYANLPFVHIYCCNEMPNSYEGNSGALNQRVTLINFKKQYLNGASGIMELAEYIWEHDAGSVLDAAKEGLKDLIENKFQYAEVKTMAGKRDAWQLIHDPITMYVNELQSGEWQGPQWEGVDYELGKIIYEDFSNWCKSVGKRPMGKHLFYKLLETKLNIQVQPKGRGGVRFESAQFKSELAVHHFPQKQAEFPSNQIQ